MISLNVGYQTMLRLQSQRLLTQKTVRLTMPSLLDIQKLYLKIGLRVEFNGA